MSKYDRDAIEIYILDHIDTDNYGKQFTEPWKWIGMPCQGGGYVRPYDGVRCAERAVA